MWQQKYFFPVFWEAITDQFFFTKGEKKLFKDLQIDLQMNSLRDGFTNWFPWLTNQQIHKYK